MDIMSAKTVIALQPAPRDDIGEPVVALGPFVMSTRQEIGEAIGDYQAARFDAVSA